MAKNIKNAIMGIKLGMTQIFDENGKAIPVTVVQSGPNMVIQKKKIETEGYDAIQVGFSEIREKLVNKPKMGHFQKAKVKALRYVKEFRTNNVDDYEIGSTINIDVFAAGDVVDVVGTSKGKGFAGVVKRHNFHRGSMGHGSKYHRRTGSLGAKGPARVFPGRPMPGHMGNERVTVQGLTVVKIYPDRNIILVKGAIPGPKKGLVIIKNSVKA